MEPTYFPNAELSYLKVYDVVTVQHAFEHIAHNSQIEFNFPQGGCQQRAHIMSLLLAKNFNIEHCKVWLFPPVALYVGDTRTLYIDDKNKLTPNNKIEWNYHVAPVVQVRNNGSVDTMVFDPSINYAEPIFLDKWFDAIGNSHVSKYSFLLPDKYFFYCCYTSSNMLTTIFDGSFFNYEDPMKNDLIMEKGLAMNDMAIRIFHKYIHPLPGIESKTNKVELEDLKACFGNPTALDLVFAQNLSGYSENTTLRYLTTHYSDIINEARTIFNERLAYWVHVTNTLF